MSFNDPRILDLTAFDRHDDDHRARKGASDLHMLRLALDLQLDAMLLTLGAVAHAESRGANDGDDDAVPWRRWLLEDLELARTLAVALVVGEAAPAHGIGGGFPGPGREKSLDNLVARYTSMEKLLAGVLERPPHGEPWRATVGEAHTRCRARLAELHEHRREIITAAAARTEFLPGELLG